MNDILQHDFLKQQHKTSQYDCEMVLRCTSIAQSAWDKTSTRKTVSKLPIERVLKIIYFDFKIEGVFV